MELKPLNSIDVPGPDLAGVTTAELARMLHGVTWGPIEPWDELSSEMKKIYYTMAAKLIMDWPKA